jgi:hypothetical protein
MIANYYPFTCAMYAQAQGLIDTPGWKRFRIIVNTEKNQDLLVHQASVGNMSVNNYGSLDFLYQGSIHVQYYLIEPIEIINGRTKN